MKNKVIIDQFFNHKCHVLFEYLVALAIIATVPGTAFTADDWKVPKNTKWSAAGQFREREYNRAKNHIAFTYDGKNLTGKASWDSTLKDGRYSRFNITLTTQKYSYDYTGNYITGFYGTAVIHESWKKKSRTKKGAFDVGSKTIPNLPWQAMITDNHLEGTIDPGAVGWDIGFKLPIKGGEAAKEEVRYRIIHSGPFYDHGKDDPLRAGDIVVHATDQDKISAPGKLVFFYVNLGDLLDGLITIEGSPTGTVKDDLTVERLWRVLAKDKNARLVGYGVTNHEGLVIINYIENLAKNIETFLEVIKKREIRGNIKILTVDPDSYVDKGEDFFIEFHEQEKVPIEIQGVAKIQNIAWLGPDERTIAPKEGFRELKPYIKVRTRRGGGDLSERTVRKKFDLPYYLLPGDEVVLEKNDWVHVTWLTGANIKARPKSRFLDPGEKAYLKIADENAGWWIERVKKENDLVFGAVLSVGGVVAAAISIAFPATLVPSVIGFVLSAGSVKVVHTNYQDATQNPLFLEAYSSVLMDIKGPETDIYLVEGRIVVKKGSSPPAELTTGHKVSIDRDGNFGPVTSFSAQDVKELVSVLEGKAQTDVIPPVIKDEGKDEPDGKYETIIFDDFNEQNDGKGQLNFREFALWRVTSGGVDLIGNGFWDLQPGNGLYVDLDGSNNIGGGTLESFMAHSLPPGRYELEFDIAGHQWSTNTVVVSVGNLFRESFTLKPHEKFRTIKRFFDVKRFTMVKIRFEQQGNDNAGILLDNVSLNKISTYLEPITDKLPKTELHTKDDLLFDDFDLENKRKGVLNYSAFANWEVVSGSVDLIGKGFFDYYPEYGLYIDLDGSTSKAGTLVSKTAFRLEPGNYKLKFDLASSPLSGPNTVTVALGNSYREKFTLAMKTPFKTITRDISVSSLEIANLSFKHTGGNNQGILLDNVSLSKIPE